MTTIERIEQLAREQYISMASICKKIGVSRTYFGEAKARNRELSAERLTAIADVLGTTVEYLRGETDQKEKPTASGELSETQIKLLKEIEKLSQSDLDKLMEYLDFLNGYERKKPEKKN